MKIKKRSYSMTARAAKAQATRKRIRVAAMELYHGTPVEDFTLDEVARRADTTVQTILRAFGNKDELIYAALDEMASGGVFLKPTPPGDIKAAVAAFFDIYEGVGDLVIERLSEEKRRPALKPSLDEGRRHHRLGVEAAFAPQLDARHGASRRELLGMLTIFTDVYVWKLLRRDMLLDRPASEAIVRKMIGCVIAEEKSHGTDSLAQLVRRRKPAA
jgi:AcrR family transcriptional regulator